MFCNLAQSKMFPSATQDIFNLRLHYLELLVPPVHVVVVVVMVGGGGGDINGVSRNEFLLKKIIIRPRPVENKFTS
jgi:hypothetical protein